MDVTLLLGGGVVVLGASILGGMTGFGFSLVCAPLLLLAGMPLTEVVVVNLAIGLATRFLALVQLRRSVNRRRSAFLALGCVPGLLAGTVVRDLVGGDVLKAVAGAVAVAVALQLLLRPPAAPADDAEPPSGVAIGAVGALGGFLGITTSLNGPPPVILLSRQHAAPREFVADLAVFFVVCNALALGVLAVAGGVSADRVGPALAAWLPGALIGNVVGLALGTRLPVAVFRSLTLVLVVVTGLATVASALGGL